MKATLKRFTRFSLRSPGTGWNSADLICIFELENGREVRGSVNVEQVGVLPSGEIIAVVSSVHGLPSRTEYDRSSFGEKARHFYAEQLTKNTPGQREN